MADLHVTDDGWLAVGGWRFPCALGRADIRAVKREGDGATPAGIWPLREVFYRPDRLVAPRVALACTALTPEDGWCDDPDHPDYNRRVRLPHPARCETLWRADGLYDLLAVIGYNDSPPVSGAGSAIFLHVTRQGFAPTEGCVALAPVDLRSVLSQVQPGDRIHIGQAA